MSRVIFLILLVSANAILLDLNVPSMSLQIVSSIKSFRIPENLSLHRLNNKNQNAKVKSRRGRSRKRITMRHENKFLEEASVKT